MSSPTISNFDIFNQLSLFQTSTTTTNSNSTFYQLAPLPQDLGVIHYVPPPPTPAEIQRERMDAYRAQLEEERKKTQVACAKALDLLWEHLTPEQKEQYNKEHAITVKGGQSGYTYKIYQNAKVWCWKRRTWYCIVVYHGCEEWIPPADMVLAKKLIIEGAEDYFLQKAIGNFGSAGDYE